MKGLTTLFGVGVFLLFAGVALIPALTTFRTLEVVEPHNVLSGNTSATFILANDVLDDNKVNITVTSPEATDAPVPWEYVKATRSLTINGLDDAVGRQLSVTYKYPRLDGATDTAARFFPAFIIIVAIALCAGAGVGAYRESRGG
jgi:hypothetical protein